ncbi:FadR/GntR family transcriptional regulator [Paenibacillus radicis (ex Gao et al. 2016)]|uniref:GntR family transcriptional regulator n=1 Tax=Paenibacillus radicis (ex Gao et al. 2016) TaxID=1737354 RepID=A0A917GZP0_9BACL|nr:FadR/GntR family transcriptional regulator [Paenibacillus radicis (ex Gao et al. 2016)]GGG62704.1 GntR family transcriptional regulator [Paenibacillus radicis (ex Gao et al. 2016)]
MKITTAKGHELVAEHLLTQIREGAWQPGQRLPSVVELAELYGVGRSTIREAVSALKATGWLDVRHGGGTFVKTTLPAESGDGLFQNADSLIELLEVRKVLEIGAVSLAADRRSAQHLERLEAILHEMERSLEQQDISGSESADTQFHMAIVAASGNSLLIHMMESLSERFAGSIRQTWELWFYKEKATASRLLHEHRQICAAIASGDKQLAEQLVDEHLSKVIEVLREAMPQN